MTVISSSVVDLKTDDKISEFRSKNENLKS